MAKKRRLTKKQRETRNRWLMTILFIVVIFFGGYLTGKQEVDFSFVREQISEWIGEFKQRTDGLNVSTAKDRLKRTDENLNQIHIFDIGQGASTLMIDENETTILIDTGRHDDSEKRIISYLDEYIGLGNKIDLLIFTHNHSDHIGHGDLVLEYFDVKEVWMNGMDHTTKVYDKLLDALLEADADYLEPKAGENFSRGNFNIEVLHPLADSPKKDHNDESIVTRISFAGISLMTSGDASIPRENDIIKRTSNTLQSDLLLLGHHGASNSSGENWLNAVNPRIAFYQAGINNTYGHPHEETIERLEEAEIPVYGIDEFGEISIYINENNELEIETEK